MAYPDDLLDQADALMESGPGRPRQANLRRAVSAAYYACFHEVVDKAATSLLSNAEASGPVGARLRRVVDHRAALKATKWFSGPIAGMPPAIRATRPLGSPPVHADLARFCGLFDELQAERHRADYDLIAPFKREEAQRRVADARAALGLLRGLESRGDTLIFLLGCVLGDGLTRNSQP